MHSFKVKQLNMTHDWTLSTATTAGQSGPGRNDNEGARILESIS